MELFLNKNGEIACDSPDPKATVADLIEAVSAFCRQNIDCAACKHTCCAGLTVYADTVFLKSMSQIARQTMNDQDNSNFTRRVLTLDYTGRWAVAKNLDGRCKFLSHSGRCLIYACRPLVCRLHICLKCDHNFQELKNSIYYAYQTALQAKMHHLAPHSRLADDYSPVWANPVMEVENYKTAIRDILAYKSLFVSKSK
ncbi:MAG: YkgJ family cysteine cluster protein [Negativicutes bacterium]|nr:YkgJ family cysteine cluster protein [Negativicutes bacterium]